LGVVVMIGPHAIAGLGKDAIAACALLGSALSYAAAAIWGLRLKSMPPLVASTGQITVTALLAVPVSLAIDQPWQLRPSGAAIGAIFGIALLSTALGYVLYFRVLATAGATNALLVTFLIPPSALMLGIVFLDERPGFSALLAMILIFVGIALVDGRLLRKCSKAWPFA
jgi:drug/metabolite transporter (DMT)-like permease